MCRMFKLALESPISESFKDEILLHSLNPPPLSTPILDPKENIALLGTHSQSCEVDYYKYSLAL